MSASCPDGKGFPREGVGSSSQGNEEGLLLLLLVVLVVGTAEDGVVGVGATANIPAISSLSVAVVVDGFEGGEHL